MISIVVLDAYSAYGVLRKKESQMALLNSSIQL
ncbi:hypothetical protein J2Z69_003055 [Paenibacillus shirakamiensis]|uniref:Uncharacterized protein n=1 Tax=Paenibacillus shirakamiensis TaxID=1265935 RepID=A0ABS4JJV8_9BACL|nr:hypothetical protein [Paenibacillus shirakamiensis]